MFYYLFFYLIITVKYIIKRLFITQYAFKEKNQFYDFPDSCNESYK